MERAVGNLGDAASMQQSPQQQQEDTPVTLRPAFNASQTTLVDEARAPQDKAGSSTISEKRNHDIVTSDDDQAARDSGAGPAQKKWKSLPSGIYFQAVAKVRSKLRRTTTMRRRVRARTGPGSGPGPSYDSYPDTVYMWRALVETRL